MQRYTIYFIWKLCNVASCWIYIRIKNLRRLESSSYVYQKVKL